MKSWSVMFLGTLLCTPVVSAHADDGLRHRIPNSHKMMSSLEGLGQGVAETGSLKQKCVIGDEAVTDFETPEMSVLVRPGISNSVYPEEYPRQIVLETRAVMRRSDLTKVKFAPGINPKAQNFKETCGTHYISAHLTGASFGNSFGIDDSYAERDWEWKTEEELDNLIQQHRQDLRNLFKVGMEVKNPDEQSLQRALDEKKRIHAFAVERKFVNGWGLFASGGKSFIPFILGDPCKGISNYECILKFRDIVKQAPVDELSFIDIELVGLHPQNWRVFPEGFMTG